MRSIAEFFKRIQSARTQDLFVRTVIQEVLKRRLSIDVPASALSFSSSTLIVSGISHAARSELFIKKESVLRDINSGQDIRQISDIR